ncbi:hypothetical protein NL676_012724 [Syzygium grande]|nr:hypothetical protein NL676_012724 [Syzygium grande]
MKLLMSLCTSVTYDCSSIYHRLDDANYHSLSSHSWPWPSYLGALNHGHGRFSSELLTMAPHLNLVALHSSGYVHHKLLNLLSIIEEKKESGHGLELEARVAMATNSKIWRLWPWIELGDMAALAVSEKRENGHWCSQAGGGWRRGRR